MEEKELFEALKLMREASPQRKFTQSVEFGLNFKGIDFKKATNRISVDVTLPHGTGRASAAKVLVFVQDRNFAEQLKEKGIPFMMEADIAKLGKKEGEKLATDYDGFLAEGPVMLIVAKFLGQVLAPKRKMPKPIQPALAEYEKFVAGMASGVKISNNKGKFMPVVQLMIGSEKSPDKELAANALVVYNAVLPVLEKKKHNIKNAFVKLTMGPAIKIGALYRKQELNLATKRAADAKKQPQAEQAQPQPRAAQAQAPGQPKAVPAGKPKKAPAGKAREKKAPEGEAP